MVERDLVRKGKGANYLRMIAMRGLLNLIPSKGSYCVKTPNWIENGNKNKIRVSGGWGELKGLLKERDRNPKNPIVGADLSP